MIKTDDVPKAVARKHAIRVDLSLLALVIKIQRLTFHHRVGDRAHVLVDQSNIHAHRGFAQNSFATKFPKRFFTMLSAQVHGCHRQLQSHALFLSQSQIAEFVIRSIHPICNFAGCISAKGLGLDRNPHFAQRRFVAFKRRTSRLIAFGILLAQLLTHLAQSQGFCSINKQGQQIHHSLCLRNFHSCESTGHINSVGADTWPTKQLIF